MAEISARISDVPAGAQASSGLARRFGKWLASERVFPKIPFVLVEGLFILVILIPFILTIYISLLKWRANRPFETARFSGLENYEAVLTSDQFWFALGRTFYFGGVAVALELVVGFVLAMLVSQCTRSKKLYTTIFLVPMMIVPIVVGYNFSMIYIDSGPLNQILAPFLERFGIDPRIRWLSHPIAAQWAIIIADIWQWTSLTFLIFLSGLLGAAQAARQRRARHGRDALADLLARAVAAAQARHRHRRHHPLDGGAEDVRSGRAADLRRPRHLDPDRRLFPVGAGVGVQQVQLRRRRLDPAAVHVLGPDLRRHLHADPAAQRRRWKARVMASLDGHEPGAGARAEAAPRAPQPDRAARRSCSRGPASSSFPIFWMVSTSFKDSGEWVTWPPHWLPHEPTLHNYAQIFAFSADRPLAEPAGDRAGLHDLEGARRRVLVCTTAALLALLLGTFLAYSISRFNVGGKYFRHTILTIRMIPPIVVAISILIYYAILIPYASAAVFGVRISLFDTYIGLILIYTVTTLPFVIWMMLTFIDEVPYTLEHAARLMGAGRMTVIWRIVLPLVASGMVVTFLFVFILNWAEFLLALTLTHPEVTTLTVLLNKFQSASEGRLYGPQAAIGTMITIPVVILGMLIQKHLVKGFSFGTIRK